MSPWRRWLAAVIALLVLAAGAYLVLAGSSPDSGGDDAPSALTPERDTATRIESPQTLPPRPVGEGLRASRIAIESEAVGQELPISVLEPPGPSRGRPLLVFLHGAGGTDETSIGDPAIHSTLADLGDVAPVVAFPDGQLSWWRDRDGRDWGRYVVREVIPAVARRYGTDRGRVAIGGISMGGFGAYHLGLTYPRRFCAVGGHSAGLYRSYAESDFGAFEDRADFESNDVIGTVEQNPDAFGSARIWNDYGDRDWFVAGNARFVRALERGDADLTARVWPGGHDGAYWSRHLPDYLRFYSSALANCDMI